MQTCAYLQDIYTQTHARTHAHKHARAHAHSHPHRRTHILLDFKVFFLKNPFDVMFDSVLILKNWELNLKEKDKKTSVIKKIYKRKRQKVNK